MKKEKRKSELRFLSLGSERFYCDSTLSLKARTHARIINEQKEDRGVEEEVGY